jgi:serine/threonine protein kinase
MSPDVIFCVSKREAAVQGDLELRRGLVLADRYQLEDPLGQGGMGEVWRGIDLRLRRPIAIKVLPAHLASDRTAIARFRREAEITAGLQHPGITVMFDIEEHGRLVFLVMELLQGRDLSGVLAGHASGLPVEQVITLATQIADALAAAHDRGVVHRDIKPANLFLQNDGRVKICDFGIARLVDATQVTGTGVSIGTPRYMAPEQFQGLTVDYRTDLYSFGCVLYELLSGAPVFPGDSGVAASIYQHVNQPPAPLRSTRPEIPAHLDRLVLELLAKNPASRPANASAIAALLRRSGNGADETPGSDIGFAPTLPPLAPPYTAGAAGSPATTQADASRPRTRRTGVIALLAGVVVVALIAGGAFMLRNHFNDRKRSPQGRDVSTGVTKTPASDVTAPVIPGWHLVRSPDHGVAYDIPPNWHIESPTTKIGYSDANGNISQVMIGAANITDSRCTGANLHYWAETGLTGGKGIVATPLSSSQRELLTGTAARTADQWATGQYTSENGQVPSVRVGNARTVTSRAFQSVDVVATATLKGRHTRCEPPRGVVHAVAMLGAQGAPIVFIAIADRGVTRQATDDNLRKIIDSIRPLG